MKWCGRDQDEQVRFLGFPVSEVWRGNPEAFLDSFEPENPALFVPRKLGLGWDLNLGAVAVKAGWIRPDDSLPDLADFVPLSLRRAMRLAPAVGGVAILLASLAVAGKDSVATKTTLTGMPKHFTSGKRAVLLPLALTAVTGLLPYIGLRKNSDPQPAVSLAVQADQCGLQAMILAGLSGAYRSAENPHQRQLSSVLSPFLWLTITGGLQILCVKSALKNIEDHLLKVKEEEQHEQC